MAVSDSITDTWNKLVGPYTRQHGGIWNTLSSFKDRLGDEGTLFFRKLQQTDSQLALQDIKELKITPATVSLAAITIATLLVVVSSLGGKQSNKLGKKKKKPKKKLSRAQKANHEIQQVLDYVEDQYVPQIDEYMTEYKSMSQEDAQYKYKYFEEMLLKELMKLDGIDVTGSDILRENRRKVIKFIQDHQKRLDKLKKEAKF